MESLVPIGIWVVIALVGVGILTILLFGLKSILNGKVKVSSIIFMLIPFIIMGALGLANGGDWATAGILTLLIMIGLAMVAMLVTSFRGLFS